jgi:hypothetical protein
LQFSENFAILLFHYDGRVTEWDEFEWSKRAIHISARRQAKWCALIFYYYLFTCLGFLFNEMIFSSSVYSKKKTCLSLEGYSKSLLMILTSRWYAKRFLHPDIVAPYEYIFIWDEDLGVEHFNAEEYV